VQSPKSETNYKGMLQEFCQKIHMANDLMPKYEVKRHESKLMSHFSCTVTVDGKSFATDKLFSSVKAAHQAAAEIAYRVVVENEIPGNDRDYESLNQQMQNTYIADTSTFPRTVTEQLPHKTLAEPCFMEEEDEISTPLSNYGSKVKMAAGAGFFSNTVGDD